MRFSVLVVFVLASAALAQDATNAPKGRGVDPEAYRRAIERLNAKAPATKAATTRPGTTQPVEETTPATRAKRVVFLLDGSGSMMNKFDDARHQVYAGVRELTQGDRFGIVIDAEDRALPLSKELLPASEESFEKAWDFLAKTAPHGSGDLTRGMAYAANTNPTVIWVVSDGSTSGTPKLVADSFRKLNTAHMPVNTVLHFSDDPQAAQLLWQLAHDSRGVCIGKDGKPVEKAPLPEPEVP